jgi:hypothetical protein
MAEERDERWMYVALGLVVAGYLVYRNWDTIAESVNLRHFGRMGSSIGYIVAPIIAAITAIARRRKTAAVRELWEKTALTEGVLREERGVKAKVEGEKSAFKADIRLTRNAFYVLDTAGRREHMRIMIHLDSVNDLGLFDAEYLPNASGGAGAFTIRVVGRATFGIHFASKQSLAWWADARKALGLRADQRPTGDDGPPGARSDAGDRY